jgi:hypothetical protein
MTALPFCSPAAPATSAAGSCRFWNNVACACDVLAVSRSGYGHPLPSRFLYELFSRSGMAKMRVTGYSLLLGRYTGGV